MNKPMTDEDLEAIRQRVELHADLAHEDRRRMLVEIYRLRHLDDLARKWLVSSIGTASLEESIAAQAAYRAAIESEGI